MTRARHVDQQPRSSHGLALYAWLACPILDWIARDAPPAAISGGHAITRDGVVKHYEDDHADNGHDEARGLTVS